MSSPTHDLINTGILMGIIYVLTGPDHLSAMATLCGTNITSCNPKRSDNAFLLGIRWGLGHSLGLSIFSAILIAITTPTGRGDEWIMVDPFLNALAEGLVGLFMLTLGAYGLFKADKNHRTRQLLRAHQGGRKGGGGNNGSGAGVGGNSNSSVVSGMSGINFGGGPDDMYSSDSDDNIASMMENVLDTDSRCSFHDLHDDLSACLSVDDLFKDIMADDDEPEPPPPVPKPKNDSRKRRASVQSLVTVKSFFKQKLAEESGGGGRRQSIQSIIAPMQEPNKRGSRLPSRRALGSGPPLSASMLMKKHTEENTIISGSTNNSLIDKYIHILGDHIMGNTFNTTTPGLLSLLAGLIQGVAGTSSVLGVIPSIQLHDPLLAATYLGTFCATSTVVMGGFAAFYGTLSKWLAGGGGVGGSSGGNNRVFMVEVGSALLSLCAGCIWLILVTLGKLEEVFP